MESYREVSKERILQILDKTEKAVDEQCKSDHLTTLVQSFTHLSGGDYRPAILVAWVIIENYCKTQYFLAREKEYSEIV